MVISLVCHHEMSLSSVSSMSLLYAEIVHGARGEIRFRFEVVSRTSFRSGDPIISIAAPFHAWSCQSGLMVSRWNVRCLSDQSTDIYVVRTRYDIRTIHADLSDRLPVHDLHYDYFGYELWSLDVVLVIVPLYYSATLIGSKYEVN